VESPVAEQGVPSRESGQSPADVHTCPLQDAEVEVLPTLGAGEDDARRPPRPLRIRDVVDGHVEVAEHVEPLPDVVSPSSAVARTS
jgi:hypothetical protein